MWAVSPVSACTDLQVADLEGLARQLYPDKHPPSGEGSEAQAAGPSDNPEPEWCLWWLAYTLYFASEQVLRRRQGCRDLTDSGGGAADEIDDYKVGQHFGLRASHLGELRYRKLSVQVTAGLACLSLAYTAGCQPFRRASHAAACTMRCLPCHAHDGHLLCCSSLHPELSCNTLQESRALGRADGRVRVYKLQAVMDLVTDKQKRVDAKHEAKLYG